ncbi:MAG: hypothetical protein MZW92_69325 [Comamonadaceae bacterium]|nr:hypothetical protein [Comamonadaceae bacterium]
MFQSSHRLGADRTTAAASPAAPNRCSAMRSSMRRRVPAAASRRIDSRRRRPARGQQRLLGQRVAGQAVHQRVAGRLPAVAPPRRGTGSRRPATRRGSASATRAPARIVRLLSCSMIAQRPH